MRGVKSGWDYTFRLNGGAITEDFDAVEITTSSMLMKVKAINEVLRNHQEKIV